MSQTDDMTSGKIMDSHNDNDMNEMGSTTSTSSAVDKPTATREPPLGLPRGLPPHQHLTFESNGYIRPSLVVPYSTWVRSMLQLFRLNGVHEIMMDAWHEYARYDRKEAVKAHHEDGVELPVLTGAEKLRSPRLSEWDESNDMTLLLVANALIDASVGRTVGYRLVGMNPHEKWEALEDWFLEDEQEEMKAQLAALESFRFDGSTDVASYVDEFMRRRAILVGQNLAPINRVPDKRYKELLMAGCSVLMPKLASLMEKALEHHYGEHPREEMSLCRFVNTFTKQASGAWAELNAERREQQRKKGRGGFYL